MFLSNIAFLSNLSSWEIVFIFAVILLFFGAKRLPELSESLGKSLRRFKKATTEAEDEVRSALDPKTQKVQNTASNDKNESDVCTIEGNKDN